MSDKFNMLTQMSIDLKKFRIRVHKESLHLIGDPEYIQFLVNVDKRLIAIRAVEKKQVDLLSYKVDQNRMDSDFSFEIYSRPLLERLSKEFGCFDNGKCYRLIGTVIDSEKTVVFPLDSLQIIDSI